MANRTYGYRGDNNDDVVVVGGGRVNPAVRIAKTYLSPDSYPVKRGGGYAGGGEGDSGRYTSPDGSGNRSSLSASAAAGGGAKLLAIGGSLLVLSLVIHQGGGWGGNALASPSAGGLSVWYRLCPAACFHCYKTYE